eukprot:7596777-Pyramimonas_sp.AAC.1
MEVAGERSTERGARLARCSPPSASVLSSPAVGESETCVPWRAFWTSLPFALLTPALFARLVRRCCYCC